MGAEFVGLTALTSGGGRAKNPYNTNLSNDHVEYNRYSLAVPRPLFC